MVSILNNQGRFKTPVKAFRTHGSEFIIYVTDFPAQTKWEDMYACRVCILNARPTKQIKQDLQYLLQINGYHDYFLSEVIV